MSDSLRDALANPHFDALTIQLAGSLDSDPPTAARDALDTAVAQVLGTAAGAWTITAVHERVPGAYDLFPPSDLEISIADAFDLQYALQEQAAVATAEALFETNLDNVPEPLAAPAGPPGLESLEVDWFAGLKEVERSPLWSLRLIKAQEVWSLTEGEGVTIGHPDSGYIPHPELDDSRIMHDKERDFYDGDDNAQNPQDRGGNHGLSTSSVILSGHEHLDDERFVIGVAPKAAIIPMRITKKGPPIFLFRSGPRRVRDAVYYAIDSGCDVISMSLGGIGESSLRRAIQEAVKENIIVLAAAGNNVPFVVWPARYPETIAVAACDANRDRWSKSSRGATVDITAPGHNVWRAYIDEDGRQAARPSSGTSYATAALGGVAALWLSFHGREKILQKYAGKNIKINDLFRQLLAESADKPPLDHGGQFGAGIVNVKRLLETPLPEVGGSSPALMENIDAGALSPDGAAAVDAVAAVFDTVPQFSVQERLTTITALPGQELDTALDGVEAELLFHLVTNPALREAMSAGPRPAFAAESMQSFAASPGLTDVAGLSATLRDRLDGDAVDSDGQQSNELST